MWEYQASGFLGLHIDLHTIGVVLEDDSLHHLVETVGNTVAVFVANLGGGEVGCDDGEELLVVTLGEQVNHRIEHVAEVKNLGGLRAKVINGKHLDVAQALPLLIVGLAQLCDVTRLHDADAPRRVAMLVADVEDIEKRLERPHQCCLSVAALAAK